MGVTVLPNMLLYLNVTKSYVVWWLQRCEHYSLVSLKTADVSDSVQKYLAANHWTYLIIHCITYRIRAG